MVVGWWWWWWWWLYPSSNLHTRAHLCACPTAPGTCSASANSASKEGACPSWPASGVHADNSAWPLQMLCHKCFQAFKGPTCCWSERASCSCCARTQHQFTAHPRPPAPSPASPSCPSTAWEGMLPVPCVPSPAPTTRAPCAAAADMACSTSAQGRAVMGCLCTGAPGELPTARVQGGIAWLGAALRARLGYHTGFLQKGRSLGSAHAASECAQTATKPNEWLPATRKGHAPTCA